MKFKMAAEVVVWKTKKEKKVKVHHQDEKWQQEVKCSPQRSPQKEKRGKGKKNKRKGRQKIGNEERTRDPKKMEITTSIKSSLNQLPH